MGDVRSRAPRVAWILAAFSQFEALLDRVPSLVEPACGPIGLASERFAFDQTDYYRPTMGAPLLKQFFAGANLVDADALPTLKLRTNQIEERIRESGEFAAPRPLNLDPGYLDSGKVVLASTKDHAHRLYLGQGIYGEVTLHYQGHAWTSWPWTYPDYRLDSTRAFFDQVRQSYRRLLGGED